MSGEIAPTARAIQRAIDGKTKPLGALGRLEPLAVQIAARLGTLAPRLSGCTLTIFAADHGIAAEGVSAYPPEVTRQMVLNFLDGGAAATVFARTLAVEVRVVDAGIAGPPVAHAGLIDRRIAAGTRSSLTGPAMDPGARDRALAAGRALGAGPADEVAAFGDMGIGNTAAAALIAHKLAGLELDAVVGRGTGLDHAGLARKREVLAAAAARTPARLDATESLRQYGGFEIAMMAGAMIGAAEGGRIVLVDGVIATAAAMVAEALEPGVRESYVFAHLSGESGHGAMLDALGAEPLLALGMRLGEGTGALLAWPLLQAAAAMLTDMASFESAGVSGPT